MGAVDRHGNLAVESTDGKKKTLKDDRADKRKAGANKEFNWSMLYMNVRLLCSGKLVHFLTSSFRAMP